MKKILFILLLLPFIGKGNSFLWPTSNGNINITNATVGFTLHGGDTVYIPPKSGGYRSFSFSGIGAINEGSYIVILFEIGTFITPSSSNLFANSMDNSNWVEVVNGIMQDHIDPAMSSYANTGYSQHIWWNNWNGRGSNGFFPGSPQSFTLPAFNNDSTRCFKDWTFTLHMDSLDGGNSGSTCVLFGDIINNQVWINPSFINCYFGHYSSASGPAGYINAANSYNLQSIPFMYNDTIESLGVVANPNGHAAAVFLRDWLGNISHCRWGKDNFCTCVRIFQNADLAYWSAAYTGTNKVYDNISFDTRKYCFVESRSTFSDTSVIHSRRRPGPHADKNTIYNMGIGTGLSPPSAYKAGLYEIYDTDSIFFHGNDLMMCRDSVFTAADGPFLWTYSGTGPPAFFDSAGNNIGQTWALGYLADSVSFFPKLNSFIYNAVPLSSFPAWITNDFYSKPVPTVGRSSFGINSGIDMGAVQLPLTNVIGPIPVGVRIKIM
jgi:hypothetical protein